MFQVKHNRVKVHASGGDVDVDFNLSTPLDSFTSFRDGEVKYVVLAATGEWQVGTGVVLGSVLSRGTCEENYLGTNDQIDFTGLIIQAALVISAGYIDEITIKLNTIEEGATGDLSGAEIKLLYEAEPDTNAFDDAAQSKLAGIELNATADQIAVEVPFDPTATNAATNVQEAIENNESNIDTHTHDATQVSYDPSTDTTTEATILQDALEDHGVAIEQSVPTLSGVLTGGKLSGVISSSTFNVTAGTGLIMNTYDNPVDTVAEEITWNEFSGITVTPEIGSLSVASLKILLTMDAGVPTIVKIPGKTGTAVFRDHIMLGTVDVINGLITNITPAPSIAKQTATDAYDLMQANINFSGGQMLSVEGALSIWQKGGEIFFPGINWYDTSHKTPNILLFSDTSLDNSPAPRTPLTFSTMNQVGFIDNDNSLTVIPTSYDDANTVTPLPTGKATVHRVYTLGFNDSLRKFVVQYGQKTYDSAEEAKNNYLAETFITPPEVDNLFFLGYIGVTEGATSFSDGSIAWIISGTSQSTTSSAASSGNHATLTNRDTVDQHPIVAIGDGTPSGQLPTVLGKKSEYYGEWVEGPLYPQNAMVTSGSYLSIVTAIDGTLEAPSPTLIGDPFNVYDNVEDLSQTPLPPPVFASTDGGVSTVLSGMLYNFSTGGFLQQILVKVPEVSVNTNYKFVIIIDPNGATPSISESVVTVSDADTWAVVATPNTFVGANVEFLVYIESHTTAGSTLDTQSYVHLNTGNGAPNSGELILTAAGDQIRVAVTDNNAVDKGSILSGMKVDDTISIVQDSDGAKWTKFKLSSVGTLVGTAPNDYYEFTGFTSGVGSAIDNSAICTTTTEDFTDGSTFYYEDIDYLVDTDLGVVTTGYLKIGAVVQNVPDNAYSVDLKVQYSSMSSDWKILASSEAGATAGDGGDTSLAWGGIIGTIANQTDLQTELDLKANTSQVLTDVPAGALFTDTTYSIGNGGLTERNFTAALEAKLNGITDGANNYVHPTADGDHHVSATGTSNNKRVLTAGPSEGSFDWIDPAVISVAGKTGVVTLAAVDVGLENVDNVADIDKPISTLTQAALDNKVDNSRVLTDVPAGAVFTDSDTIYTHPTNDGSLHVTATGTTNNKKVLTAGATAGTFDWETPVSKTVAPDTPPTSPIEGAEWFDSATGTSYTWYAFGTGQWVKED